jgi:hypothetical protein
MPRQVKSRECCLAVEAFRDACRSASRRPPPTGPLVELPLMAMRTESRRPAGLLLSPIVARGRSWKESQTQAKARATENDPNKHESSRTI